MTNFSRNRIEKALVVLLLFPLLLCACSDSPLLTEIDRCMFINQKIDLAKQHLDEMDRQMAASDGYAVYGISSRIIKMGTQNGEIDVLAYCPIGKADSSPVVIFSHGLTASAESQLYLLRGLARRGYIVFAPDHHDPVTLDRIGWLGNNLKNDSSIDALRALGLIIAQMINAEINDPWQAFSSLTSLSDEQVDHLRQSGELLAMVKENIAYRLDDIEAIRTQLASLNESDAGLAGKINIDRLILAGHSLGGTTITALAVENRYAIEALICLSPAMQPFNAAHLAQIKAPILYMSGDLDGFHDEIKRAYDSSPSPKMFQSIKDGGHIIFTDFPFLYGLGIPFVSEGQSGFTNVLPIEDGKSFMYPDYARQLDNFQGKALTIMRTVGAFISQSEGDCRGAAILADSAGGPCVYETEMQ